MANYIKAQVMVVGSLHADGRVTFSLSYSHREHYLRRLTHSTEYRTIEGTCEPNDLPYVVWAELESEV